MNNTKTRTLAIVAVLTAATLVVGAGTSFAATTTQSVFAYQKNKGGDENSKNGNTVTPQTGEQYGIVSGFDNSFNQELQNVLCTHPSATCSTEGSEGASQPTSSSSTSSHSSPSTSTSSHSSPSTSTSSSAQQRLQGLKQDTSSPISPSSSCTVGSFGDLVQTICIPLPMP
jgi:hypothetical protein